MGVMAATGGLLGDRFHYCLMAMAENVGAEAGVQVKITVAVKIPGELAFSPLINQWVRRLSLVSGGYAQRKPVGQAAKLCQRLLGARLKKLHLPL